MCVSIILHNYIKDYPLIIANNRDENIDRNFSPPMILGRSPLIVGGLDMLKHGTWLGINSSGIVINLLNKWKADKPFTGSNDYKSRGLLVLELLKELNVKNIIKLIKKITQDSYLPFYLILSDIKNVFFVEFDEYINIVDISNQNFIAGNLDPFSNWEKFEIGKALIDSIKVKEIFSVRKVLKRLLKYQKGDFNIPSSDYSVNLGNFQTTSSTILEINSNKVNYFFSNGKPLNTDYQDYSYLLKGA